MSIADVWDNAIERRRKQRTFTVLSDSVVWYAGNNMTSSLQLTNKQIMDLQSAKKEIIARSRKEKGKKFYLNVDDEGEVHVSEEFIINSSGFCYKNGSEIALPEVSQTPEPKVKGKKQSKQTEESANSNVMKTKKNDRKAKASTTKEKVERKAPAGSKELSAKELAKKIDAGATALNKTGHRFTSGWLKGLPATTKTRFFTEKKTKDGLVLQEVA